MQKILIEETDEVIEFEIIDPKTGLDWSMDFLGNHYEAEEFRYVESEDCDLPVMTQDEFVWWADLGCRWESADRIVQEFFDNVDCFESEDTDNYTLMQEHYHNALEFGSDLGDYPEIMMESLESVKTEFADIIK